MIAQADYARRLRMYTDSVRSGERIAGENERHAVNRYIADREKERDKEFPYKFDRWKADRACQFIELLEHSDGEYAGNKFILYPWQVFIVANLFGWVNKETGYRRFREAFLTVGRGNGKSPFGAAIMLYLFCADDPPEPRCEVYTAAVKRDQAAISFNAAKRFVDRGHGMFRKRIQVYKTTLTQSDGSEFLALSSDGKTADGKIIHGLLRDELHAWSDYQREYYEKLGSSFGKRRQPLAITITTAGSEQSNIWQEDYTFASMVVNPESPINSDSLFVMIFEIDEKDDELNERSWHKANPMLEHGVVKIDYLRDEAAKGRADPARKMAFRRYHCNRLAYSHNKTFTPAMWKQGAQPIPYDEIDSLYAGADLGWRDDLAAVGYVAPLDWISIEGQSKRRYAIWADVWIPAGSKRDLNREPYASWIRTSRLTKTESEWTDTAPIYRSVDERHKKWGIRSLAYDPANAREFALNCENELGIPTFGFQQQHAKYNEPFREFIEALTEGRILHGDDSLLAWATMNVVEEQNSRGHRMPAKKRSVDKIDPFVAVLMAFSECMFAERKRSSVYETRGPLLLG